MGQFGVNSLSQNQAILKEYSLDSISGIQTMVDNMNKSSNVLIPGITTQPVSDTIIVPDNNTLPGIEITPLAQNNNNVTSAVNSVENKVNSLNSKQLDLIEVGLLGLIVILLAIAIFK